MVNAYQGALFRATNNDRADRTSRFEARKLLREVVRVIGSAIVDGGRSEGEQLYLRDAIADGYLIKNVSHGTRSLHDFGFLKVEAALSGIPIEDGNEARSRPPSRKPVEDLSGWVDLLMAYVDEAPVSRTDSVFSPLNVLCDWLIAHGHGLKHPADVKLADVKRSEGTRREVTFLEYLERRFDNDSALRGSVFGQTRLFYEWYQREQAVDFLIPFRRADQPRLPIFRGKTSKEALPAKIIEAMRTTLSEDDFAWAKQFTSDYVKRDRSIWSPVRAYALYTLLSLPLRTIQVRLLDSGEGDERIYDAANKSFVTNPRGERGRRESVLREFHDRRVARKFTGFYINANKTQALYSASKRRGYEIMWENKFLIALLASLRDWQLKYNRMDKPVRVNDLSDSKLHAPKEISKLVTPVWFLFRDPASKRTSEWEPISYVRIERIYLELLAEVERRFAKAGEEIGLITAWKGEGDTRKPDQAIVTLHSLRVSHITIGAENGLPLQILTTSWSGHSSAMMNVYYQNFGFATTSELLTSASQAGQGGKGASDLARWMEEQSEKIVAEAANSDAAFQRLCRSKVIGATADAVQSMRHHPPGLWSLDIDGLCPNGRTLCHEGGPLIGTSGGTRTTPVPGGRANCPCCRFWVMGTMFLFGQVVKSNVLLYQIQERMDSAGKLRDEIDDLQAGQAEDAVARRRIVELRAGVEVVEAETDILLQTWVKRYEYLVRSDAYGAESGTDGDHVLVTTTDNPSFEVCVTEGTRFDLLEFVNQTCEVIPSVDVASARFRKTRLLDQMLGRNGRQPLFFSMTEDQALRTGNALTRCLTDVVGQQGVTELLSGERSLTEAGIHEFDEIFHRALGADAPCPQDGTGDDRTIHRVILPRAQTRIPGGSRPDRRRQVPPGRSTSTDGAPRLTRPPNPPAGR